MRHIAIVKDYIHAWSELDVEKIMSFLTPDCMYHNIPMDPLHGTDAIRTFIESFVGMSTQADWELHQIAETPSGTVLTERTDKFLIAEKWVAIPVMGVFEFRDGKISAWRDYFDMEQVNKQIPQS